MTLSPTCHMCVCPVDYSAGSEYPPATTGPGSGGSHVSLAFSMFRTEFLCLFAVTSA